MVPQSAKILYINDVMQKEYVRSLFDNIAHRYDILNHLLSGGVDLYWRRAAIRTLLSHHPKNILDVATGTADFALAAMRLHPEKIIGVDISESMLEIGRNKIRQKGLQNSIELFAGEAEKMDFRSGQFDAAIVAFGARNFEDLDKGLSEMHRVVRIGGRIVVLEFSRPNSFPWKQFYFSYFKYILPVVGRLISKDKEAYQYLPDTVMKFPEGNDFLHRLRQAGFSLLEERRLTFGIATIYSGVKEQ